jgi:hypothetical protein
MCRFSDAGSDDPSTRSGGRRLKSAKARNRGSGAPLVPRALWGLSRGVRLGEVGSKRPLYRFASQDGCLTQLGRGPSWVKARGLVRERSAGNPPAAFDERGVKTESWPTH